MKYINNFYLQDETNKIFDVDIEQYPNCTSIIDNECKSILLLNPIPLSDDWLIKFNFKKGRVFYWLDLVTHYIEMVISKNIYYPVICQINELSSQDEQFVHTHNIEYVHELQNLVYCNFRKELKL